MHTWITLGIVTLTYAGIAAGSWPGLRANRTTITLMGAGLLLAVQQISLEQIGQFIDLNTLILLFSMMIINANLQMSGFFRLAGSSLLRMAHTPRLFLAVEILLSGLLSAFFLNDTICLMFTPFILNIMLSARRNPIPYLIALATAALARLPPEFLFRPDRQPSEHDHRSRFWHLIYRFLTGAFTGCIAGHGRHLDCAGVDVPS